MTVLVDTSVLGDYLRGKVSAAQVLEGVRADGPVHASEITRLEVLAGIWHVRIDPPLSTTGRLGT
ncbi:MAG: hypothetical protein H0T99_07295 [Geodermatophilaceae bacterium]|nr:hypothetical protein [Geodermatophilaceae bacterium]MDQ3475388.1 hypothetical protein [Actinomycetota bacterium]